MSVSVSQSGVVVIRCLENTVATVTVYHKNSKLRSDRSGPSSTSSYPQKVKHKKPQCLYHAENFLHHSFDPLELSRPVRI